MKTRHIIIAAFALTVAGCQDTPQTETIDPQELRFEVTVAEPGDSGGAGTRAVKTGWYENDVIVVHFDGSEENTLWLKYNADGEWITTSSNVATVKATGGTAQALHSTFLSPASEAGGSPAGTIEADGAQVFTDTGSYIVVESTVYVSLTLDQRVTSRITVEGLTNPADWVLAGPGIYVGSPIMPGAFGTEGGTWAAALAASFVASDIETGFDAGLYARGLTLPWEAAGTTSFMVMCSGNMAGTTFKLHNVASNRTWTRTYQGELTSGKAVTIMRPEGEQSEQWTEILKPVTSATLTVTAPVAGADILNDCVIIDSPNFDVVSIEWMVGDMVEENTKFGYDKVYRPQFYLKAKPGYMFDITDPAGFTINGMSVTESMGNLSFGADNTELLFTVDFPATQRLVPAVIFEGPAPTGGAPIPAEYQFPNSTAIDWCEFEWSGGTAGETTFAYNTVYTLTIKILAWEGCTFAGRYGDDASVAGFTVNGNAPKWVANDGTTLTISYTFAKTGPVPGNNVVLDPPQENNW